MIPTAPPAEASILVRSLWQILVYVLGAMLVGSWIWVWNTNNTLHDLQSALLRMPEVVLRAEANRAVLDAFAVRLARLEESSALSRDDRLTLHRQLSELRVDHARILEILRQAGVRPPRPGPPE